MTVLPTTLDPTSPDHRDNRDAMLAKLAELDAEHAKALGEWLRSRHLDIPEALL